VLLSLLSNAINYNHPAGKVIIDKGAALPDLTSADCSRHSNGCGARAAGEGTGCGLALFASSSTPWAGAAGLKAPK